MRARIFENLNFALLVPALLILAAKPVYGAPPIPGTVVRAEGSEGLSRLYRFDFDIVSPAPGVNLAMVVGAEGSYSLAAGRTVHGLVTAAASVGNTEGGTLYRITLEPAAAALDLRIRSRVFKEMSLPQIVESVLSEPVLPVAGQPPIAVQATFELTRTYPTHEAIAQFEESDWAFVERLLEQEGMHYRFAHAPDGHTLVVTDRAPTGASVPLSFGPAGTRGAAVHELARTMRIHSGAFNLGSYDYTRPDSYQEVGAAASRFASLYVSEFPVAFHGADQGRRLAETRLAAETARALASHGLSSAVLTPGQAVRLAGHPDRASNGEYVIIAVRHTLDGRSYRSEFSWLPRNVPFAPPADTPVPRIAGIQPAVVTGPSGEDVFVDDYGRVRVRLLWDENPDPAMGSVGWVRVAQPSWADMRLPRVGDEVAVAFEHGDPARPVVIGSLYNAGDMPPYALPDAKTVTTIRSRTSPGGGGSNELMLGDAAGSELVRLRAQKNMETEVLNDQRLIVGHDHTMNVSGESTIAVGSNQRTTIGGKGFLRGAALDISATDSIRLQVGDQYIVIDRRGVHVSQGSTRVPTKLPR